MKASCRASFLSPFVPCRLLQSRPHHARSYPKTISVVISCWSSSGAAERANYQIFLSYRITVFGKCLSSNLASTHLDRSRHSLHDLAE